MKGDFSQSNGHLSPLRIEPEDNYSGVLHQQGRVLLDSDWNEQTGITTRWQDQAGRDVIGPGVAAVPAAEPDGGRVQSAVVDASGRVELAVRPGRVWADGLLAYLPGEGTDPTADVRRIADYLQPPIQDPPGSTQGLDDGVRDAVVLEVWREALNGFQEHRTLIEPALGGPDTTERVLTAMRFRLYRLEKDDTCRSIVADLQDDFENKGKLRVSLQPPTTTQGDCPVEEAGGYVGFEHFLYRVEVAQVNVPQNPPVMFKWSQFNGGLVGRGTCDLAGANKKITITANDQAIKMSGLNSFYLEVVELDAERGFRRVTYGAKVTLNGDDLDVAQEHYKETSLPTGNVFFRLWNEIRPIADFPRAAAPQDRKELRDGILLEFETAGASNYQPSDYWTFQVRAGGASNPETLIDDEPPQGIHYHRVPLAVLNWNGIGNISFKDEEIEDCRDVFQPLTNQSVCCSFTVGDGVSSHGDFDSIEQAVRHLPATGGEVCLLPGLHEAGMVLEGRQDVKIRGCGKRTTVIPSLDDREGPIFRIVDCTGVTLECMDLITYEGTAVVAEGTEPGALQDVTIRNNRILAYENGVRAVEASNAHIRYNKINVLDKEGAGVAVYVMAEDSVIEGNSVSVVPAEASPTPTDDVDVGEVEPTDPTDPCADLAAVYGNIAYVVGYADFLWEAAEVHTLQVPENPFNALGGIQIAGGSERVRVLENSIRGGAGNGVTLGSDLDTGTPDTGEPEFTIEHRQDTINGWAEIEDTGIEGVVIHFQGANRTTLSVTTGQGGGFSLKAAPGRYGVTVGPGYRIESIETFDDPEFGRFFGLMLAEDEVEPPGELAFMYEIRIAGNDISGMGLSGIGTPRPVGQEDFRAVGSTSRRALSSRFAGTFAGLSNPVVNLEIQGNHIFGCLQNPFDSSMRAYARLRGFGGVALGMCGRLSVHENRIENNGTTHVEPACGVYLAYGERVEITHNTVLESGPIDTEQRDDLQPGVRGGIFLGLVSSLPVLDYLAQRETRLYRSAFAVRVHDNVVEQPAGQALRITGAGPISVVGNRFASQLSGGDDPELPGAAVLIRNLGDASGSRSGVSKASFGRTLGMAAFATTTWGSAGGNVLFNDNQTWVDPLNQSPVSQMIVSQDDIGFDGNQSDNLNDDSLIVNTLLSGATLRATDNRFKEVLGGEEGRWRLSLYTVTEIMNNVTNNQADHCIFAFNLSVSPVVRPVVAEGNQVLDDRLCRPVIDGVERVSREKARIIR